VRLLKRLFIILLVIIAFIFIASRLLIPLVENNLLSYCRAHLNTSLQYSDVKFNFLSRNLYLNNFAIKDPVDPHSGNLLFVDRIVLTPALMPLFKKKFIFHRITLEKPRLFFRLMPDGGTNWDSFRYPALGGSQFINNLLVKEILIKDGNFHYIQDFQNKESAAAELRGIFAHAKHCLIPQKRVRKIPLYTSIKMHAYIPAAPLGRLKVTGFLNIPRNSFLLKITMDAIPLPCFNSFLPEDSPIKITGGTFSVRAKATAVNSRLNASPEVMVKNLQLKLAPSYETEDVFHLPAALVIEFFDIYKEQLKFTFQITGTLDDPQFHLQQVIAEKMSQLMGESIINTITSDPGLILKMGGEAEEILEQLKDPLEQFIDGLTGK